MPYQGDILRGEKNAVEDYLGFLKSGSSAYPLEVLKRAGVDLDKPQTDRRNLCRHGRIHRPIGKVGIITHRI